jgi:hypothetical protein
MMSLHEAPDEEYNSKNLMPATEYNHNWKKIAKLKSAAIKRRHFGKKLSPQ